MEVSLSKVVWQRHQMTLRAVLSLWLSSSAIGLASVVSAQTVPSVASTCVSTELSCEEFAPSAEIIVPVTPSTVPSKIPDTSVNLESGGQLSVQAHNAKSSVTEGFKPSPRTVLLDPPSQTTHEVTAFPVSDLATEDGHTESQTVIEAWEPVEGTATSAFPLNTIAIPPATVAIGNGGQLWAAAPSNIRQRYQALTQLLNRYESAVIAAEAGRDRDTTPFLDTVRQARRTRARPQLPRELQTLRQGVERLNTLLATKDYTAVNAEVDRLERLIWQYYPTNATVQSPETRAIWFDRGTIVKARSEQDLAQVFNRLADAGINTVFFETLNASYPVYPSQIAPTQNPLTRGWDPLAAAVKLAHERDMELHAWLWIFAAANQRHNEIVGDPTTYTGPVLSRNPHWAMLDRQGNPFQPNSRKAFFDPAHPEARAYLLSLIDEVATKYDVDGIQLDYIRYPFQDPNRDLTFGYGIAARRQFQQRTGRDPAAIAPQDPQWRQWEQFKIQQVNSFVQQASTLLDRRHPDVLLSAAVFPFPAHERLPNLQQNWETWLNQDYLDFLVPMTYAEDTAEFQSITQNVLDYGQRSDTLVLPGVRLLKLPTVGAFDQLQHLQDRAAGGYALFAAENLGWSFQQSLGDRHGGSATQSNAPIPHRQPLAAAHLRYQTLQQEWQYWVRHQQQILSPFNQETWATQSTALELQLAKTAQNPSLNNVRLARRQMNQFQLSFRQWFNQPSVAASQYRVQAWQNRLAGIEQLLRYGERQISE